jgi:hypothetical protein
MPQHYWSGQFYCGLANSLVKEFRQKGANVARDFDGLFFDGEMGGEI